MDPDDVEVLFGTPVCTLPPSEVLDTFRRATRENRQVVTAFLNSDVVFQSARDPSIREYLENVDLVLPDGQSIVFASRVAGDGNVRERVSGPDILRTSLELAEDENFRVYFLGTKEPILETMVDAVCREYPELDVAGYRDGYFSMEEESEVVEAVNQSEADFLYLGVPFDKRRGFIERNRAKLEASLVMGVGGAFDVMAGEVERAPQWMQDLWLEWFWRFLQEPQRLWKRYLISNSYFLWRVWQEYKQS